MKKLSLFLGMALAASLSLTDCTEKIEGPIAPATPAGIPFEISADISTKTTNNELATKWATGDAINLFHAEPDADGYVSDGEFKLDATRDGVFKGNLTGTLDASKSYDWYAIYPYNKNVTTPAARESGWLLLGQTKSGTFSTTQTGNDSKAHLCGKALPLYGVAKGVASDVKPAVTMKNLASVVAVKVKNTTTESLVVKSVSFTSTEDIVGTYYIDFTGENVVYTGSGDKYVSATASLTVNNGEAIAANSEATFFIPIKPHKAALGTTLKISVNGYEKPLTLPKDVTFTAGSIKTLAFDYNKVVVDYVTIPWTEDFSGDTSLYMLSNSTKRDESYAKGSAPELMVKGSGSFSAKVKAGAGNYILTFKSNNPDFLTVLSSDKNVAVTKNTGEEYLLTVPEGRRIFTITIKNTHKRDNVRIDDISLVADTAVKVPVITVDNTNVSVKAEGGNVTLKYSIKYPATGATIAASSKETWVNTFDYKTDGEVTFAVDANEGEARAATVTLSYPDATPVTVTVSQSAKGAVTEPIVFGNDWNTLFGTKYSGSFNLKADALSLNGSVNGVSIKVTNGTSTNGYIKTNDFRAYNGYTITFTAPEGSTIKSIVSTKGGKTFTSGIKADSGNLSIKNNAISWTGDKQIVKLTISGTVSFATITITL